MRHLTEKQRKFLDAYLGPRYCSATEAARIAGYTGTRVTLATIGSKTRRSPLVAAEIAAALARQQEEHRRYIHESVWGRGGQKCN